MRIVIIGVGEVGYHVAKALSQEDHDIIVMDIDPAKCRRATETLDVIVVEGNGASPRNLSMANVQDADYVLCLTRVDEVNLIASQQAHELGAKKIIARLRNQQYTTRDSIIKPEKFGIDLVIHPEKEACREIVQLVRHSYATQVMDFEGGRMQMIGIRLENDCPIIGNTVREICEEERDFKFGIITVIRDGESHVPWSDFKFKDCDIAYFIVKTERLESLMYILGKEATQTNSIIILGGSKIGRSVAEELENEMSVRLIDSRRDKAEWLASNLKDTMVLHGDGTDAIVEFDEVELSAFRQASTRVIFNAVPCGQLAINQAIFDRGDLSFVLVKRCGQAFTHQRLAALPVKKDGVRDMVIPEQWRPDKTDATGHGWRTTNLALADATHTQLSGGLTQLLVGTRD